MSVYSIRLLAVTDGVSGDSPYISSDVPDDYVWVLRDVTVTGSGEDAQDAVLSIYNADGAVCVIGAFSGAGGGSNIPLGTYNVRIVMNPGEFLRLFVVAGSVDLIASGYQLSNA